MSRSAIPRAVRVDPGARTPSPPSASVITASSLPASGTHRSATSPRKNAAMGSGAFMGVALWVGWGRGLELHPE